MIHGLPQKLMMTRNGWMRFGPGRDVLCEKCCIALFRIVRTETNAERAYVEAQPWPAAFLKAPADSLENILVLGFCSRAATKLSRHACHTLNGMNREFSILPWRLATGHRALLFSAPCSRHVFISNIMIIIFRRLHWPSTNQLLNPPCGHSHRSRGVCRTT